MLCTDAVYVCRVRCRYMCMDANLLLAAAAMHPWADPTKPDASSSRIEEHLDASMQLPKQALGCARWRGTREDVIYENQARGQGPAAEASRPCIRAWLDLHRTLYPIHSLSAPRNDKASPVVCDSPRVAIWPPYWHARRSPRHVVGTASPASLFQTPSTAALKPRLFRHCKFHDVNLA